MSELREYPLIVAHRGASAHAPENTISAFREAVRVGADGIEFDVRISADGIPFVFHDSNLKRICGIEKRFDELPAIEIDELDCGAWFSFGNKSFIGERIPRLDETLDFLRDFNGPIYVELKGKRSQAEQIVSAICPVLAESDLKDKIIVKSFKSEFIPRIRACCPDVEVAALFEPKILTVFRKDSQLIKFAKEIGATRLSLHSSLATKNLMKKTEKSSLPVSIWTVDDPIWVERAAERGIDHVLTNFPAELLKRRFELFGV